MLLFNFKWISKSCKYYNRPELPFEPLPPDEAWIRRCWHPLGMTSSHGPASSYGNTQHGSRSSALSYNTSIYTAVRNLQPPTPTLIPDYNTHLFDLYLAFISHPQTAQASIRHPTSSSKHSAAHSFWSSTHPNHVRSWCTSRQQCRWGASQGRGLSPR